jgi:hypothetical protein
MERVRFRTQKVLPFMYRIWYTPLVGKKSKALTGIDAQSEAPEKQGK